MSLEIPVLALHGSAHEIGYQHGRQAKRLVHHNIELYFRRFQNELGLHPHEVIFRARAYLDFIQREAYEYAESMKGVAEGAGCDLLKVVALNIRYEIMNSEFNKMGMVGISPRYPRAIGCTAIAVEPSLTVDGHLYLAQNWDWIPGVAPLIVKIQSIEKPSILCFTEAGIVGGKIGLNSRGLGLLINGIVSNQDSWSRIGIPFHVRCWKVLNSENLQQAIQAVSQGLRPCSCNFVLGHADQNGPSSVLDIEAAPELSHEIRFQHGFLVHTNHFYDPNLLGVYHTLSDERTNSINRYKQAEKLLLEKARKGEKISINWLKSLLANHKGGPGSICRHRENLPEDQQYQTVFSVIMDLHKKTMWWASGPPCKGNFIELSLG